MKAMREELYEKIGKEISGLLENYDEGEVKLDECVVDLYKIVGAEQYGKPSVNEVFSRFTEYAVEKLLVNAVYCDHNLVPGARPSFKDFTNVFIEAGKDERKDKPFELLVVALKRMVSRVVGRCLLTAFFTKLGFPILKFFDGHVHLLCFSPCSQNLSALTIL
ncbi:unnamed protein product [Nippostrongylus brasiliensis]|uniref:Glycine--tRNA ligase n=1 Tax=Nippostrongylus brasiliensis TaxID=27835 RepID=A0A0N4XNG1_NIPBR|nr:unnamed protein product [Nippostrongylus brasiliensis]